MFESLDNKIHTLICLTLSYAPYAKSKKLGTLYLIIYENNRHIQEADGTETK